MKHFYTHGASLRRLSVARNCRFLLSLLAMTLLGMNTFAEGTVKVYYTNPNSWAQPYVYAWNDGTYTGGWPGKTMTWNNEKSMWEYEGPACSLDGILFHNNSGWQSANLQFFANGIYGTPGFGEHLYVKGSFNGWDSASNAKMKTNNGVNYILEKYNFALTEQWPNFKITHENWDCEFGLTEGDDQMLPNTEKTMTFKGKDAWMLDGDAGDYTAKFNTQTNKLILLSHKEGYDKSIVEFDKNRSMTFSSIWSVEMSSIQEDVKVYYATGISNGEVILEEVDRNIVVAPNTGLYLFYTGELTGGKAEADIYETADDGQELVGNKLMAWAPGETCASLDHLCLYNYAFGKLNGGDLGFIHMKANKQNNTSLGKAYLQCQPTNGGTAATSLKVRFKGDSPTTKICVPKVEGKTGDNTTHNLNGQTVSADQKGLVIRNGKSIMNK